MTTPISEPPVPVPAKKTSRDLVAEVLAAQAAAGTDTGDAMKKLADAAAKTGVRVPSHVASAGTHTGTPTPVAGPPAPTGLVSPQREIVRPNGDTYFVRKMGIHDDVEMLREARRCDMPVLMYSGPGTGKTAMFEAAFTMDGFYYVPGTGDTEVSDFVGSYVPTPGGGFLWVDGPLVMAMEAGLPLLVDEIALIDTRVMAVVYSVMDGRGKLKVTANPERLEVEAKPGFIVMGACNPNAPGARMSEALVSRFPIQVEVGVDFTLMRKMGVPAKFVTVAQNLKKKYDSREISWYPAIREMLAFKKLADMLGEDTALANVVSSAPEIDRPQVADALTRGYGMPVKALEIK